MKTWNRREVIAAGAALGTMPGVAFTNESSGMRSKPIPSSGESLPVIGLGTYSVFDVESTDDAIATRKEIVERLVNHGGSLLDTSPMYNRSERVIGDVIAAGVNRDDVFLATKVWTDGRDAGVEQMQLSVELMRTKVIDLMQVHNLRGWQQALPVMREWQQEGRIRYIGITTSRSAQYAEFEKVMLAEDLDFIQINYSLEQREAAERLLPLAADRGMGVIINRAFGGGRIFSAVGDRPLPDWAQDFGCTSWAQFLLKYALGHPAATLSIPGMTKLHHVDDNFGAGQDRLPSADERQRQEAFFDSL